MLQRQDVKLRRINLIDDARPAVCLSILASPAEFCEILPRLRCRTVPLRLNHWSLEGRVARSLLAQLQRLNSPHEHFSHFTPRIGESRHHGEADCAHRRAHAWRVSRDARR